MQVFNPLRKVSIKTLKTLKNIYGVDANIFYPAIIENKAINGHNDIVYKPEPDFTGKVVCPSYFKYRDYLKSSILDPFQENPDIIIWTDIQEPFKLYSKVVFLTKYSGISTFKIINILTESDDEGNFIHKHFLSPIYGISESDIQEQALNEMFNPDNITEYDETRDTTQESIETKKYNYSPIK